jgi:hypothetical protein
MSACCRRPFAALPWARLPLHEPPNYDCCCGIYAVASPERALQYLTAESAAAKWGLGRVIGTVALWGRVVEAEWGWRAACAYPLRLYVPPPGHKRSTRRRRKPSPDRLRSELEEYGVPVEFLEPDRLRLAPSRAPEQPLVPVPLDPGMPLAQGGQVARPMLGGDEPEAV